MFKKGEPFESIKKHSQEHTGMQNQIPQKSHFASNQSHQISFFLQQLVRQCQLRMFFLLPLKAEMQKDLFSGRKLRPQRIQRLRSR